MFGAIPIGDNTVTVFLPDDFLPDDADASKKSQAFVISIACFPPAFDPRSK